MSAPQSVDEWLSHLSGDVRDLAEYARELVGTAIPEVVEEIRWERPCFLKSGLICYFTAKPSHVNLGFFRGNELWDVDDILEGQSKNFRHLKIRGRGSVHEPSIRVLLEEAAALNAKRPHPRWV